LYSILLQHTNSPRVGLDSHFSGESVSFRDYTLPVKIDMSAPEWDISNAFDWLIVSYNGSGSQM
jgi:hypothetical protein